MPEPSWSEEQRDDLIDLLPAGMRIWGDESEIGHLHSHQGTAEFWHEALGHTRAHRGCCKACGCAATCILAAFHDALIASVVRELDRLGALRQPAPAARVEVRDPCPYCDDHQLIPRRQMVEHVSRLHPDEPTMADAQAMLRRMADDAARSPVRCPHCDAGPIPPTHWTKHLQRHHPNVPPVCSGTDGFCPAHGFHRHGDQLAELRESTTSALLKLLIAKGYDPHDPDVDHAQFDRETAEVVDAVLPAFTAELQRLRAETATADQLRADVQRERDRLVEDLTAIAHRWDQWGSTDLRTAARILRDEVLDTLTPKDPS